MVNGPGGSFLLELELELRRNLRMAETQRKIMILSRVSVSVFVYVFFVIRVGKKGTVVSFQWLVCLSGGWVFFV